PGPPVAILDDFGVVHVGDEVVFDAVVSQGDEFAWEFGDGSSGEGTNPTHAYTEPGRYTVILSAVSSDGRTDTASASVTAVYEPLALAPAASTRTTLGDGLLVVSPESGELTLIHDDTVSRLSICEEPVAVAASGSTAVVACRDDELAWVDTAGLAVTTRVTLPWGSRPEGVVIDPETGDAIVTLGGGAAVARVDAAGTLTALAAVPDARALVLGAEARLFATRFRSPSEGGEVYAAGESEPWPLAIDPGPDSDTDARGLPSQLGALAGSPDGRDLVVGGAKANIERGLERDGQAYTFETASRAVLRRLDATTGAELADADFDNRDLVGAVAYSPLGDRLFVAHYGTGVVDILDPWRLTRLGGLQSVGVGLDGLVATDDTLWVLASVSGEIIAYDIRTPGAETELARYPLWDDDPLGDEARLGAITFAFAGDPRMSKDGYLSCASCHFGGGTDARTWDFTDRGEGFRDTQALFAMPSDGPFHWSANFDELQDFENAIRAHQSGTGFMDDGDFATAEDPLGSPKEGYAEELDALATYIRGLSASAPRSPHREDDGSYTTSALAGRDIFYAEGCDTCHAGPESTDAGWNADGTPILHDVGTIIATSGQRAGGELTGLRTPSLRGLFATAPYLHDGRAATLEEALAEHGLDSSPELVSFLLQIEAEP
ncbi:MAG: PKD domain-containing protein, partial [Deltaproteobacteria bacterium]|nr:PKD domain-containing protein [Deltaproteobacteria bacterium]